MCSKILKRYIACINKILTYVTDMAEHYLQIDDQNWLIKLWPLILTKYHFNYFNLCLQGNVLITLEMCEERKCVVAKLFYLKITLKL
jgi:hypothetical protein